MPAPIRAAVAAALLLVANIILLFALVAIGWGLRGSTYEAGRPTNEDLMLGYVRYGIMAALVTLDIVIPVRWFARRREPEAHG
jgi:hypothetical protein